LHSELKGPWSARAEDLCESRGRLSESGVGEILVMVRKIGYVVNVEYFND